MALIDPIATGNTAKIYVAGETVSKVYTNADLATVEMEASKQRAAHALGLSVPAVIKVTEIDGKPVLVMNYVPGETMLDSIGDDWSALPRHLARSVSLQRAMHQTTTTGLPPMRTKLEHQIRHAAGITEKRKAEMIAKLDHIGSDTHVCHGDFHLRNLIVNGNDVTIIDWMDATSGNLVLDVCRSYVLYGSVSDVAASMYLQEYCLQSGQSADEVLRWQPVIAAARLSETVTVAESERLLGLVNPK